MPKCKNDVTRNYQGTEPSPKGLGYCGHAEPVGKKRKGKDGNMWIVKATEKGVKRWVKVSGPNAKHDSKTKSAKKKPDHTGDDKLDCSKVVRYGKKTQRAGWIELEGMVGIELEEGYIYKNVGFNEFAKKQTKIPKGYKKDKLSQKEIKQWYCDPNIKALTKDDPLVKAASHPGMKYYMTHDNMGRPFIVYIAKDKVYIYKQPDKRSKYFVKEQDRRDPWTYMIKVIEYKPQEVFIGKSPVTEMTKFSGGHGKKFDGNTILLKIGPERYVYIGEGVYEFSTKGDTIKEYISPVGNNDVPYPVAVGDKNIYFMLDKKYIPLDQFPELTKEVKNDAYSYFYGHEGDDKNLMKKSKKMQNIKVIHKRVW